MEKYVYSIDIKVRDYELDAEGIVNNANYLHYTEHTRHRFLKACGLSFAEMHEQGTDAVVARMNLEYKAPLRCDDIIVSRLRLEKQGIRYIFVHDLFREADGKLCFRGRVELVTLVHGRKRCYIPILRREGLRSAARRGAHNNTCYDNNERYRHGRWHGDS